MLYLFSQKDLNQGVIRCFLLFILKFRNQVVSHLLALGILLILLMNILGAHGWLWAIANLYIIFE